MKKIKICSNCTTNSDILEDIREYILTGKQILCNRCGKVESIWQNSN